MFSVGDFTAEMPGIVLSAVRLSRVRAVVPCTCTSSFVQALVVLAGSSLVMNQHLLHKMDLNQGGSLFSAKGYSDIYTSFMGHTKLST